MSYFNIVYYNLKPKNIENGHHDKHTWKKKEICKRAKGRKEISKIKDIKHKDMIKSRNIEVIKQISMQPNEKPFKIVLTVIVGN